MRQRQPVLRGRFHRGARPVRPRRDPEGVRDRIDGGNALGEVLFLLRRQPARKDVDDRRCVAARGIAKLRIELASTDPEGTERARKERDVEPGGRAADVFVPPDGASSAKRHAYAAVQDVLFTKYDPGVADEDMRNKYLQPFSQRHRIEYACLQAKDHEVKDGEKDVSAPRSSHEIRLASSSGNGRNGGPLLLLRAAVPEEEERKGRPMPAA